MSVTRGYEQEGGSADLLLCLKNRLVHLLVVAVPPLHCNMLAAHVVPQPRFHHEHELPDRLLFGQHFGQGALAVVHGVAPALHEEQQPQLTRCDLLQHLPDGQKILQAFAHLAPLDVKMPRVQEVVHPPAAQRQHARVRLLDAHSLVMIPVCFSLSHLVVVVGKLQVHTATVHVERGAQQL